MKFVVLGAFLLLQVFTVKSITVPFYSLLSNATGKCDALGHTGFNSLDVSTTNPTPNVTQIDLSSGVQGEKVNISSAVVVLTASGNKFNVEVNVTADGENQHTQSVITEKGETIMWKNTANGGKFEQIRVNSYNFSGNASSVMSCFDMGLAYKGDNDTNRITVVTLGCCGWTNETAMICLPFNNTLEAWANAISSNICNGAFSSLHITPIFALLLAVFVSFLNKL